MTEKNEKPKFEFKKTPTFRKSFSRLSRRDRRAALKKFQIFKNDPWDRSLNTHKINRLSAIAKTAVWSVAIRADLRALFVKDGNVITSIDIGTHEVYDHDVKSG